MKYDIKEIKKGIKIHYINTDKFKTNLVAIFLTTDLDKETVTKNALIAPVLTRGTTKMPTQEEISKELEGMYGALFDCGIEKKGNNQILKFYIESVNDRFLPDLQENLLTKSVETLLEIVFSPYIENGAFKKEYVEQEKNNLKQVIEGRKDNKAKYALDRCMEEMYKGDNYEIYRLGYAEDIEKIDEKNLYEQYQKLINNCKIDIFISGILDEDKNEIIEKNQILNNMKEREGKLIKANFDIKSRENENIVFENMDVVQGKLVLGLDVNIKDEKQQNDVLLYNSILGGSANSKLFQNVREKASLAYTASSSYLRIKNSIFINCGIEIENYDKALKIIKEQISDMKEGKFTDEEVENVKKGLISAIKAIDDEQDTQIMYLFGQEFSKEKVLTEEYEKRVRNVSKQDIIDVANLVKINTIYFLTNKDGGGENANHQ